jgi:hypothetical protein
MLRPFCVHAASQITVYVRCSIMPLANAPLGQARAVPAPASRKTRKAGRPQAAGLLFGNEAHVRALKIPGRGVRPLSPATQFRKRSEGNWKCATR